MSSSTTNDETNIINCDTNCDNDETTIINCDSTDNTNESIDITSPVTKIDDFIVVDDNKSQLVNSIQTALDSARLACAFAVDIDTKIAGVLSKTKDVITLGKRTQMNVNKYKICIDTTLETLKVTQKLKNKNIAPISLSLVENIHLLSKKVLELANKSVNQITDVVTTSVETKKVSISAGKAILTIKTAILNAQQIANSDTTLSQTVKDEIIVALQATKTALGDAIVADINISSVKSQSEITKVATVNALTYSKKTMNSAKANVVISKDSLNNLNKITANIPVKPINHVKPINPVKPIKSIRDIQLKAKNMLIETNKVIESSNCIIKKLQTAQPRIVISVTSMQKMIESLEKVLSLLS